MLDFLVLPTCPFLGRRVPIILRFIDRTYIRKWNIFIILKIACDIRHIKSEVGIMLGFEIRICPSVGIAFTVKGIINRRRITKHDERVTPIFMRFFQKELLALLFLPIKSAVLVQKTFCPAGLIFNSTRIALFRSSGTQVESPHRKTDSFRITLFNLF